MLYRLGLRFRVVCAEVGAFIRCYQAGGREHQPFCSAASLQLSPLFSLENKLH